MKYLNVMFYKMAKSYWFFIMILAPVVYGISLFLYLERYDSLIRIFVSYTVYFNCAIPFGIALMISLYVRYEEQIGHFNHLLQLRSRKEWSKNLIFVSLGSVYFSTLISCIPLWMLIGNHFTGDILLYSILTTIFTLPVIIILWFMALKINTSVCLGMGIFFSIFLIYFGANSLGDSIWQYIPLLYGTRYLQLLTIGDYVYSPLVWGLYTSVSLILFVAFLTWFNKWEGRKINE
ncbi:hypothetical protein [Oceanobacillus sp. AG]|uniref:BsaG family lantibiotic immunity ABC transporter permease subunit n=1 Tax=Oceanobacillus sp. AG TaxID=2681969 RepID=UPI0012EB6926|nr:hypothetical protein [Oceanobacillus sp. AG]